MTNFHKIWHIYGKFNSRLDGTNEKFKINHLRRLFFFIFWHLLHLVKFPHFQHADMRCLQVVCHFCTVGWREIGVMSQFSLILLLCFDHFMAKKSAKRGSGVCLPFLKVERFLQKNVLDFLCWATILSYW